MMKTAEIGILPFHRRRVFHPWRRHRPRTDWRLDWRARKAWKRQVARRSWIGWSKAGGATPPSHAPWMTADSGYHGDNSGTDNTRGIGTANSNWPAEVQRLEARKRHLVRQTNITVCRCQPDCVQCVGHICTTGWFMTTRPSTKSTITEKTRLRSVLLFVVSLRHVLYIFNNLSI